MKTLKEILEEKIKSMQEYADNTDSAHLRGLTLARINELQWVLLQMENDARQAEQARIIKEHEALCTFLALADIARVHAHLDIRSIDLNAATAIAATYTVLMEFHNKIVEMLEDLGPNGRTPILGTFITITIPRPEGMPIDEEGN